MARVYVGTYRKYNEGSINGGWLDLADYPSYKDFLGACHRLHKDESDPEFMIQDNEGFPDGLDCMEWMSESEFNEVKKAMNEEEKPNIAIVEYSEKSFVVTGDTFPVKDDLKRLGGMWFRKAQGWLFSNRKREAVESFIGGAKVEHSEKNDYYETLKEFTETQCKNDSDKKYYLKEYVGAIKLRGFYYLIDKPHINNRFCFHDEGPDYEFYKELMADKETRLAQYFREKNEAEFTNKIDRLGEGVFLKGSDYKNMMCVYIGRNHWGEPEGEEATKEEVKQIEEALKYGLSKFRTRIDSYLKRYGTSKLHTWTYWADA